MIHTPYGYEIIGGRAVINDEQAAKIRQICKNYLAGMSLTKAAASVGITMGSCGVKRIMLNRRYLGNDFYPAILTEETVQLVKEESARRESMIGFKRKRGKNVNQGMIYTNFTIPRIAEKFEDPVHQAEYAYSLIRNEVSEK